MADKDIFQYTYSAPQQTEVVSIREKYMPREVSKMDQLRSLDASVTKRGMAVSIAHGVLFSLILGLGMSCCMVWSGILFVPGVAIGCVGLAGVISAYPIYTRIVKQDREKITPEILRLSDELIMGNN